MFFSDKKTILVSSCLLGNNVRYDGSNKYNKQLKDRLNKYFTIHPVCPEFEAGFGIPREQMDIYVKNEQMKLITKHSLKDKTDIINKWFVEFENLAKQNSIKGFVCKSKSPSCALNDTGYYDRYKCAHGPGLFVLFLKKAFPNIAIIDEKMALNEYEFLNFFNTVTDKYNAC